MVPRDTTLNTTPTGSSHSIRARGFHGHGIGKPVLLNRFLQTCHSCAWYVDMAIARGLATALRETKAKLYVMACVENGRESRHATEALRV